MDTPPHKDSPGIKALKIGVIATGIFLIIGVCAMTVAILVKARMTAQPPETITAIIPETPAHPCSPGNAAAIPIVGGILTSDLQSSSLVVTSTKQVLVIDTCTGKVRLNVQSMGQ